MPDTPKREQLDGTAYLRPALKKIRRAVSGNGVTPDDVKVLRFEGDILVLKAETTLTLSADILESQATGKTQGTHVFPDEKSARSAIEAKEKRLSTIPETPNTVMNALVNRADKGLAPKNSTIPLPSLTEDFIAHIPCSTCHAKGDIPCAQCRGSGYETCRKCHGRGTVTCPHCRGSCQITGSDGKRKSCPHCHGRGHLSCAACRGQGRTACNACKSRGRITCRDCNGSGWTSRVFSHKINARASGVILNMDKIPQKAAKRISRLGEKLAQHVQIRECFPDETSRAHKNIKILYSFSLPQGTAEFQINGKRVPAYLFGTQTRIADLPPFLDGLIRPGAEALELGANAPEKARRKLMLAAQYRTVREALHAVSRHPPKKAYTLLMTQNPVGLSRETGEKLIKNADITLKNASRAGARIASLAGLGLAFTLAGAYLYYRAVSEISSAAMPQDALAAALIPAAAVAFMSVLRNFARRQILTRALKNKPQLRKK